MNSPALPTVYVGFEASALPLSRQRLQALKLRLAMTAVGQ